MNINNEIAKFRDEIKTIRRNLHRIPEAGFSEFKTSKYIKNYLTNIGVEYDESASTGIVAYIKKEGSTKTYAFRSDMDALSMNEYTDHDFQSTHEGFMHACGHDGHMSMLLVFAKYLSQNIDSLKEDIIFLFQPAEEGPGGAELMIAEGVFKKHNIDEVYGIHLYPEVESGRFSYREGPMMAMTGEFDIKITGKSGHGAMPHKALDAVVIAAELVTKAQNIVSRFINPIEGAVLTIGRMECGVRRNIIAEEAILEGTLRAFNESVYNTIKSKCYDYARGMEVSYGCEVEVVFRDMYPPVVNDKDLCEDFRVANEKDFIVEDIEPQMISEDFSYFQREAPGLFLFLGVRNEEKNYVFPLHNSKFNFDEEVLLCGVQGYLNLLKYKNCI
ncbi:MAG: M20 family metallopeptidase [Acidaminobacteraceae bacterium]